MEGKEISRRTKKRVLEQLLRIPSYHGALRALEVKITFRLASSTLIINNSHLSYAGEAILSITANRKVRAARHLLPQKCSPPTVATPPLTCRLCFCRGVASLPAACRVSGPGGGGGAGQPGRCRGYQGSWQDTGHVAGAGRRGGHRAVSGEQVAAHLGGRAAAPRTSALCAWPWGHGGCRGHGAGGAGGPGLPGLGASLRRA